MDTFPARVGTLLLAILLSGTTFAGNDFGVGVKAGTLGVGLEATWRPIRYFDIRVGANRYDYDDSGSQAGVAYDATLNMETYYATGNFRFPLSPFRVTAGVFSNGNEMNLSSQDDATYEIGGITYTAAEVGTLASKTSFSGTAPYVGMGFDFSLLGKVGLNLDFGVLWQGDPDVTITADGLFANDPDFQSSLEAERLELVDDVKNYKAWPVISLGFVFNF